MMIRWVCLSLLLATYDHAVVSEWALSQEHWTTQSPAADQWTPDGRYMLLDGYKVHMPFPSQSPIGQEPAAAQEHKPLLLPHIDQDMNWDSLCVCRKLHCPATLPATERLQGLLPRTKRIGDCWTTAASPTKFWRAGSKGFWLWTKKQEQSHGGARLLHTHCICT